jgi:peptide/nickel transport system substrate-binding protein
MALQPVWLAVIVSAAYLPSAFGEIATVVGQTMLAGSTDPTSGSTGWALTSHGIAEKLYTVDKDGKTVAQVAQSCVKLSKFIWEVTLKADYKFSDGTTVTAQHVVDAFTELNTKNDGAKASLGKMTMKVVSPLKFTIESEQATPVMTSVLAEWPFVIYLAKGGKNLFTGPYKVETFVKGDKFELIPNTHYPCAVERPLLTIKKFSSGQAVADALKAGELDMGFHVPVESLTALKATGTINTKSFLAGYQYMAFHNTRRSPLSDVKVRKAVDIAIDRSALAQATSGGKATRSLFPENTPYHVKDTQMHGDKAAAEKLLDEAGWAKNAQGKREKAGVALTLKSVAYPQRPSLPVIQPVIKTSLEALGIDVTAVVTSGSSWDQHDKIMKDKDFDLLLWAQHTLPAGDPQMFMNMFFRSSVAKNFAGLASTNIDEKMDALSHANMGADRVSASAAAHNAILAEAPVSFLMTPSWHVGLGSRLKDYQPWGSDYYIIHSDFGLPATCKLGLQTDTGVTETVTANSAKQAMLGGFAVAGLLQLLAGMV